mmetsp:Transcript_7271/g.30164  ORF Transcript_7271/g.30164 Transcript_7271/m.30164 type:complete len:265 (-) Transcript_7271:1122-1916(-)
MASLEMALRSTPRVGVDGARWSPRRPPLGCVVDACVVSAGVDVDDATPSGSAYLSPASRTTFSSQASEKVVASLRQPHVDSSGSSLSVMPSMNDVMRDFQSAVHVAVAVAPASTAWRESTSTASVSKPCSKRLVAWASAAASLTDNVASRFFCASLTTLAARSYRVYTTSATRFESHQAASNERSVVVPGSFLTVRHVERDMQSASSYDAWLAAAPPWSGIVGDHAWSSAPHQRTARIGGGTSGLMVEMKCHPVACVPMGRSLT